MESIGQTSVELGTVVAGGVFCLGLAVGIGGMWLAWRIVRGLPSDEASQALGDGEPESGSEA